MFRKVRLVFVLIVLAVVMMWPAKALAQGVQGVQLQAQESWWAFLSPIAIKGGYLALVIVLDLILGVVVALKQKIFEWQRLADFLGDYGPKVVAWLCLEALSFLPAEYQALGGITDAMAIGAYGLIFLSAAASLLGHAQALGVLPDMSRAGLPPTG